MIKMMKHFLFLFLMAFCFTGNAQELVPVYTQPKYGGPPLWGFSDRFLTGYKINCQYDTACAFTEGLARAGEVHKIGFVDPEGTMVIPARYESAGPFTEGFANVSVGGKSFYIDKKGADAFGKSFAKAFPFSEGLARVVNEQGLTGYINTKGILQIPFAFADALDFREGLAPVRTDKGAKWKAISKTGSDAFVFNEKVRDIISPFTEGFVRVFVKAGAAYTDYYNFCNKKGALLSDERYDQVKDFSGGRAIVGRQNLNKDNGNIQTLNFGLIGTDGKEVVAVKYPCLMQTKIPGVFLFGNSASTQLSCTAYGLLDRNGKELSQPRITYIDKLNDSTFFCQYDKRAGLNTLISTSGKEVLNTTYANFKYVIFGADTLLFMYSDNGNRGMNMAMYNVQHGLLEQDSKYLFCVYERLKLVVTPNPELPAGSIRTIGGKLIMDSVQLELLNPSAKQLKDAELSPFVLVKKKEDNAFRLYHLKTGKFMLPDYNFGTRAYQYSLAFSEGMLCVQKDYLWGAIDSNGTVMIRPQYQNLSLFRNGWSVAGKKEELTGRDIYVYVNKAGKEMPGIVAERAFSFNGGIARFNPNPLPREKTNKTIYINTAGKTIFTSDITDYIKLGDFSEGLAFVAQSDGKYGYIDLYGKVVIPFQFTMADDKAMVSEFKNGMAIVIKDGKRIVINKQGEEMRGGN